MRITDALNLDRISLELPGTNKSEIIGSLLDLIAAPGGVSDREKALESVLERESKMSTGIQHGVAIPHGKTDAVEELLVCFGRKREGIDFQALDGEPSYLFFLTLSPLSTSGPHIELLAEIGRILEEATVRRKLLSAKDPEEVLDILST